MPRWRTNSPVRSPSTTPGRSAEVTAPSNQVERAHRLRGPEPARGRSLGRLLGMALPQPGIFAVGLSSHGYLELDLVEGATHGWVPVLADLAERETTMGATNVVVGVRP